MTDEEELFDPVPDDDRLDEIAEKLTKNNQGIQELEKKMRVAAYYSIVKETDDTLTLNIPKRKAAAIGIRKGSFVNVMVGKG